LLSIGKNRKYQECKINYPVHFVKIISIYRKYTGINKITPVF